MGIVTEADLLRAPTSARVGDAMTRIVLTVDERAPLLRALVHAGGPLVVADAPGALRAFR